MGFVVLAVLVQARVLTGADYAVAVAVRGVDVPLFERASAIVASLLAFEVSIVYGIAASLLLWRAGAGRWSLAPLAFLPLTAIELLLKMTLNQPGVPGELQRYAPYPFTVVTLPGSFPSGHAIRSAFLCFFIAVLVHRVGRPASDVAAAVVALLSVPLALTRIYMGYHWISDVAAGLVLGAVVAILVANGVAERLGGGGRQRVRP